MFWQIVFWIVSTVISYLLQPKPKSPTPGKFDVPTTEEGAPVGVLYGSGWITASIVAWWGDTRTTPIKSKGGKK